MKSFAHICGAIGVAIAVAGCGKDIPVALPLAEKPIECGRWHPAELPKVDLIKGDTASTDAVNRHWARAHRLKSRPTYRRLYRDYRICSKYVAGL